jgi:hypothetical protein
MFEFHWEIPADQCLKLELDLSLYRYHVFVRWLTSINCYKLENIWGSWQHLATALDVCWNSGTDFLQNQHLLWSLSQDQAACLQWDIPLSCIQSRDLFHNTVMWPQLQQEHNYVCYDGKPLIHGECKLKWFTLQYVKTSPKVHCLRTFLFVCLKRTK